MKLMSSGRTHAAAITRSPSFSRSSSSMITTIRPARISARTSSMGLNWGIAGGSGSGPNEQFSRPGSAARPLGRDAAPGEFRDDAVAMFALDFDDRAAQRAAAAAGLLQGPGERLELGLRQRQPGHDRHALAGPALRLAPDPHRAGPGRLARDAPADALGDRPHAAGAHPAAARRVHERRPVGSAVLLHEARPPPMRRVYPPSPGSTAAPGRPTMAP